MPCLTGSLKPTSYRTMGFESLAARHSQPIKMDQVFFAEREQKQELFTLTFSTLQWRLYAKRRHRNYGDLYARHAPRSNQSRLMRPYAWMRLRPGMGVPSLRT